MDMEKALAVKRLAEEIVTKMTFTARIDVKEPLSLAQGEFLCTIEVDADSNLLIGQKGVNLQALQHLVRLLAKKKFDYDGHFMLDVNAYWEEKSRALMHEAGEAAERALRERAPVLLRPMSNFERKMVHTALAEREDVTTESVGEGDNRKVAVKPVTLVYFELRNSPKPR